ncbi:nucleotidyltransferase family protein [Flavobacteriaceae bacterium]|nr:nucleotidyltransferase family protein [Flavobacteriaceae bacterium]
MISAEEKLLVNVLYKPESEILNGIEIYNINFDHLMKLASRHLMLPALFFNINKKNISYLFPEDFIEYIKNIYSINKARNTILLKEAKELSELLYKNNINHIFLKGTALLLSNVFEDIGERMIGDIDFIIQHKDEQKVEKVLEKNNDNRSQTINLFNVFKPTHLDRRLYKTIAIEPHLELLEPKNRWVFNSKELVNDFKVETKAIKTPSKSFLFDHCIYAIQIRDKGFINSYHSHRSVYDIYKLDCKKSLTIKNIKKDIFIKHFFITINKFKIFDIHIKTTLLSSYFDKLFRFLFISFLKIFTVIDIYIFKLSLIIQLFFNNELRERALNKISIHYNNKTLLNYLYTWLKL